MTRRHVSWIVTSFLLAACAPPLPDDLPSLIQAMASNDMAVHTAAAQKVQDRYGLEGLLSALASSLPGAKLQAARFLRLMPDPRARAPLLLATHDEDAHVRGWAAYALSALPSPDVEARLKELEQDEESVVRNFATKSLDIIAEARQK